MALSESPHFGYLAGLSVSFLWTLASLIFTAASRRLSPTVVNAARIGTALVLHALTHRLATGQWVPSAPSRQVLCLAVSGVLGLTIGDQAMFHAFLSIGPRLALLVASTAPLLASAFGWLLLSESLTLQAWSGILLTVTGVAWVVLQRSDQGGAGERPARSVRGVSLALLGAACQAGGLMLSKWGMGHGNLPDAERLPPQTATLIRMTFAAFGVAIVLSFRSIRLRKQATNDLETIKAAARAGLATRARRDGLLLSMCGGVLGPFLGVWMSLVASDRVPIGVAQTLCSLPPVLILPLAAVLYKERIGPRAVFGAMVAVLGVVVLAAARNQAGP